MHETTSVPLREVCFAQKDDYAFSGYGGVFGNKDAYGDVIEHGAFAETLVLAKSSGVWPAMLMQHGGMAVGADDLTPIGVWTELAEDSVGLRVSGKRADTPRGREAYVIRAPSPDCEAGRTEPGLPLGAGTNPGSVPGLRSPDCATVAGKVWFSAIV